MTTNKTSTFSREQYVEKIRGLIAKGQAAATEAEADAFLTKAAELMAKWEVEEAELADAKQAGPISWDINHREYPLSSYSPIQDSMAMQFIAKGMGLEAYQTPYIRGCAKATTVVFGTNDDLDRFDMMWTSLSLQMTRFMKAEENPNWNRNEQRRFRLGFKVGFGKRAGERIAAARSKVTSKALVLAGKQDAIEAALPENLQVRGVKTSAAAADAGARAAERADINGAERVGAGRKAKAAVKA